MPVKSRKVHPGYGDGWVVAVHTERSECVRIHFVAGSNRRYWWMSGEKK